MKSLWEYVGPTLVMNGGSPLDEGSLHFLTVGPWHGNLFTVSVDKCLGEEKNIAYPSIDIFLDCWKPARL